VGACIDKSRVANSFSKAAITYDSAAALQRTVGYELLKLLKLIELHDSKKLAIQQILDLGCGTGYFSEQLLLRYPTSRLVGLDIAEGMLVHARQRHRSTRLHWLCADAENISLADNSVELIYSSLAIQWCENLPQLFSEISRVLTSGGVALIATLGPASLFELKEAWAGIDSHVHVNSFVPLDVLLASLPGSLSLEVCQQQTRVLEYHKLQELTSDLKKIGAHNMNSGESKGLTGRAKVSQFKQNYERFRQSNGKLPASYEVYYLQLKKC